MKKLIFVVVVTAMLIMAMAIPTTTSATGTIAEDVTACDAQTASTDDQHFFNEVPGICYLVAGDFWYQWRGTGMDFGDEGVSFRESLALWGYPLSRAFEQKLEDGSSRWVQYFERARFEFYPENVNTPYVVQQGHFGRFVLQMGIESHVIAEDVTACDAQTASTDDQHFFNEVPGICYLVAGDFWYQWRGTGMDFGDEGVSFRESLALWGYPLSRAFEQKLEDGSSRWVQYFERARFEFYPENVNTPYVVQQGHFGRFVLQMGIGGNTPLPGEAECVVAHEYQLKDLTQISADREFLHVQFWWEGVPERETLLPPGTYPIGSDWTGKLQGMVWELGGPNCTAEAALRDYLASSIQRRMNAGYLHWTWLVDQGILSVAWQPDPVPTVPNVLP